MEQREEMDLRRCDAVWQRVAPDLNPYPEVRAAALAPETPCAATEAERGVRQRGDSLTPEALTAAVEEELAARRAYLAHARCAGGPAGRALMQLASDSAGHACRLRSLYFLLTGQCYRPFSVCGQAEILSLCQFLRRRYQLAVESASQYDNWADGMEDGCMASNMRAMADDKRCQATTLMSLLESLLR
jgi:hypothetical protein